MHLTAVQAKYLILVYTLQTGAPVKLGQVAARLQVSKPSAHRMLGQFKELGMVDQTGQGTVQLTGLGEQTARQYNARYQTMVGFFTGMLHMEEHAAQESAFALLGGASEEMCRCIQAFEASQAHQ